MVETVSTLCSSFDELLEKTAQSPPYSIYTCGPPHSHGLVTSAWKYMLWHPALGNPHHRIRTDENLADSPYVNKHFQSSHLMES
jgi:hypothetical protein